MEKYPSWLIGLLAAERTEVEVLISEPYQPGSHECCCGDPECTDFEDQMMLWGIPLDEITVVTEVRNLSRVTTDEINADPEEVARLRRSRQQAREGKTAPLRDLEEA